MRVLCQHKFDDNQSQQVFFAQMMSCDVTYDVIYHPFPINSQYLRRGGLTAMSKYYMVIIKMDIQLSQPVKLAIKH